DHLKDFYCDIIQRYKDDEEATVEHYSSRDHPYPQLVGEIMMEEHEISKNHGDKLGKQIKPDQNRYPRAKGAQKEIRRHYLDRELDRKREGLKQTNSSTSEDKRKEIVQKIGEIRRELTQIERIPPNELFQDPEDVEATRTSGKVFEYKMRSE